jgi:hypothetical protein
MPKMNKHHITYVPEWTVEIGYMEHKVVTNIQRSNSTEELYARVENLTIAITHEKNRIRMELDLGIDCKEFFRGPKFNIKRRRKKNVAVKRRRKKSD